jgi:CBS domain containing-hemolysin-like protein
LEPQWIATITPTGDGDTRPPREMPLRALLPNEKLQAGPMGIAQVVRLDLQAAQAQASGAFTQDDRAMLQKILQLVSARVSS